MTTPPTHKKSLFSRIPERSKLLLLSFVTGVGSGLAAVLVDRVIDLIRKLVDGGLSSAHHVQYLILPGVGMLLSLLILRYLVHDDISHGVTKVLLAVSRGESKIKPHNMWSSMLTSSITIGLGGSVGAEAPIVYTGAAIGSNLGRKCGLTYRNITTLLGCGAAGAIAAIFKAPLAGVLFTMEILLFNISLSSMLPLLISTVSATVVVYIFRGQTALFACNLTPFEMWNIPFYIILGVLLGFGSLYFIKSALWMEDRFSRVSNIYIRWLVCALVLGVLIFLFPQLYGEGYGLLGAMLRGDPATVESGSVLAPLAGKGWGVPLFFLLIFLLKVPAMTATNSGGGVGGTFGPTLFCGAIAGFTIARSFNLLGVNVPEQNFVLVGMAAMMADFIVYDTSERHEWVVVNELSTGDVNKKRGKGLRHRPHLRETFDIFQAHRPERRPPHARCRPGGADAYEHRFPHQGQVSQGAAQYVPARRGEESDEQHCRRARGA